MGSPERALFLACRQLLPAVCSRGLCWVCVEERVKECHPHDHLNSGISKRPLPPDPIHQALGCHTWIWRGHNLFHNNTVHTHDYLIFARKIEDKEFYFSSTECIFFPTIQNYCLVQLFVFAGLVDFTKHKYTKIQNNFSLDYTLMLRQIIHIKHF